MRARLAILTAALLTLVASAARASSPGCGRGWVYFDLGDTLIDTRDWDHLRYMPGALAYLRELKAAGFRVGLITNIPADWGKDEAEKLATLRAEIAKTWVESEPFAWELLESVLVPFHDDERKPRPFLFEKARRLAAGCRILYQGEDEQEVRAAGDAGLEGWDVDETPGRFFKPVDEIFP